MNRSTTDALLDAGAVLDGPGPADTAPVTSRAYAHPALPGRTVVRLVGEPVGAAEDLTMEFLGFTGVETAPVGHGRLRAPTFPASALVQDPAHGRDALALVKEMEKLARLAKSKPGNARDGYAAIARRLADTVPHFLPGFWEQAGREFIEAENLRQAAICFGEARRAEQVHALPVDEDRLRAAHLEFALAGALSEKVVRDYSREVLSRLPAGQAYALIRSVAAQRVAGGLPPGAGFATDLRRAAKAAGLDAAAEDESVVGELVMLPAVVRAHPGFWTAYGKPLRRLARRDAAVAARLREILPDPPGWGTDLTEDWLDLILDTGALDAPDADVADWLERFARYRAAHRLAPGTLSVRLLALVPALAPRLRQAGRPLRLADRSDALDLNLVDACLAEGVPVTADAGPDGLPVGRWYDVDAEGRRDLSAVAADPDLLTGLTRGLWHLLEHHNDLSPDGYNATKLAGTLAVTPGLLAALRHGIDGLRLDAPTVAGLEAVLRHLYPLWSAAGVRLAPDGMRRIAALDAAGLLAGTLRAGLVDELGWPEYESAVAELKRIGTSPSWPVLAVSDQTRVVTVGPDGAHAEHTVRSPSGWWHTEATGYHVGGRTLIAAPSHYQRGWAYWAGEPDKAFELPREERPESAGPVTPFLPLPDGAVTGGGRPWRPGDQTVPSPGLVSSDGVDYWRCEPGPDGWRWREYDPNTGDAGRHSLPAFFTDGVPDGHRLLPEWSWLRPGPDGFAASPLGAAGGLLGWRVHVLPDGTQVGRGVDGRTARWTPTAPDEVLVGALTLPGDDRLRPVTVRTSGRQVAHDLAVTVWGPDGGGPLQECVASHSRPPYAHWHALRPRDAAGSAALRAVTAPVAAALLADLGDGSAGLDHLLDAAIARHLPQVTDRTLLRALRAVVRTARRLQSRLDRLRDLLATGGDLPAPAADQASTLATAQRTEPSAGQVTEPVPGLLPTIAAGQGTAPVAGRVSPPAAGPVAEPEAGRAPVVPVVSDSDVSAALGGLMTWQGRYYYGSVKSRTAVVDQLTALAEVFADPPRPVAVPDAESAWPRLLPGLGAVAAVAASPVTTPEHRTALARLLRAFADTPFAAPDPRIRFTELEVTSAHTAPEAGEDGRRIVFLSGGHRPGGPGPRWLRYAVDRCEDGEFAPVDGIRVRAGLFRGGWGDAGRLRAVADLLDREGATPWRPDAARRLAELTGLTRAAAALLLAGLPVGGWNQADLTAAERRLLGLTAAEAGLAGTFWRGIDHTHRIALLDAAVPADPADLWRHGLDVDALAARWLALFGRRTPIPEDLLVEAKRTVPGGMGQEVLRVFVEQGPRTWLCTDGVTDADGWDMATYASHGEAFDEGWLKASAAALAWLAYRLPAGDPLREPLPRVLELVRQRLDNPKLAVGAEVHRIGLVPEGLAGLRRGGDYGSHAHYHLVPAEITTPDDPALAVGPAGVCAALRLLRDPDLDRALAGTDGLPEGAWPQDPRHSVPGLVAEVAKAYGLETDAAAYHLQLLALPDPTDAHAARWLGRTTAQLKPLRAALLGAGLVIEARRARAGRTVFLPGGWLDLRAPALPLESWKAPLLGLRPGTAPPLGAVLPGGPVADLFHAAWSRITSGDTPQPAI